MSDSEDEGAFASADEGESKSTEPKGPHEQKSQSQKGGSKATDSSARKKQGAEGDSSKVKPAEKSVNNPTETGKKGRGKQQQQQRGKKKGKSGGSQPSPKEEASVSKPERKEESVRQKVKDASVTKDDSSPNNAQAEENKTADSPPLLKETETVLSPAQSKKESSPTSRKDVGEQASCEQPSSAPKTPLKDSDKAPASSEQTLQDGDVRRGLPSKMASPESQSITPEQRDHHTREQSEVLHRLEDTAKQNSGGGWGLGSWGSSILSAASSSVQTFTHQVGDGLTTIMDTVESSLGAPNPEDLAKVEDITEPSPEQPDQAGGGAESATSAAKAKSQEKGVDEGAEVEGKTDSMEGEESQQTDSSSGWFGNWGVADLAKKVQDTGKSLASKGQTLMTEGFDAVENLAAGGIDVLETIGKKTYNTISEHDPAFRKTREYLKSKSNRPNLSSVLREAKDQAEKNAEQEKENEEARKAHFGTLFDDYQGIAHLEALEMLSNQSEKKVHSLLNSLASEDLGQVKPSLIAIKEAFELDEEEEETEASKEEDFTSLVGQCVSELKLGTGPDKLNKVHSMVKQWIDDFDAHESHEEENVKSIHQRSIQALAELTSKGVEQFHKAGELVLMEQDKEKDCTERAHSLARLTGVLCHEVGNLSTKFAGCLNKMAEQDSEDVTATVTNVYLEASNSTTYIQDAFQLLLPVLQQAALEQYILRHQQS